MRIFRNAYRSTMRWNGLKYTKLKEDSACVFIDDDDVDQDRRPSNDLFIYCTLCLECLDVLVSGIFKMMLYVYRLCAKRYPHFLEKESNDQELIRRLHNESKNLEETVVNLKCEVRNKSRTIEQLEMDNAIERDKILLRDKQIQTLNQEMKVLEDEKQEALRRLSEQMSIQLRDNNPNIVDLNDQCRPTKLAEMFTELYDNEWTNAFSILEELIGEEHAIVVLLDIFMDAYSYCKNSVAIPWAVLNTWFLDVKLPGAKQVSKWLKDSRKTNIRKKVSDVKKKFSKELIGRCNDSKVADVMKQTELDDFITKCIELCLLMVTTDPPVVVGYPGCLALDRKEESKANSMLIDEGALKEQPVIFNTDVFKEYTTRGDYIDFIVWPALFLHQDGPLLSKGVAQGGKYVCQKKDWTWIK